MRKAGAVACAGRASDDFVPSQETKSSFVAPAAVSDEKRTTDV
jgi:hypothetical protein